MAPRRTFALGIGGLAAAVVAGAAALMLVTGDTSSGPATSATPGQGGGSASTAITTTTVAAPAAAVPEEIPFEVIGRSTMGRDLHAATFGGGEVRVYVLSAIHGDERAAVDTAPLLAAEWAAGALPAGVTVRLVPDVNPDGIVAATRANASGVDLNRNFPTADFEPSDAHGETPLSEPESAALFDDIEAFGPDLIVALHCEWEGPFAEPDGPAETYADVFVAAATGADPAWGVRPEVGYPTPGSLGTYYGKTLGIPVLTVEMSRYVTADEHWPAVQAGMGAVLALAAGG